MPSSFSTPFYTTRSNIAYVEMSKMTATFGDDQTVLTRRLACLWEDWFDFAIDMLGYDEWTSGPVLNRYLPQADPEVNGFYCDEMQMIDIAGKPIAADGLDCLQYVDDSGGTQTQGMAIFSARFRAPLYKMLEDEDVLAEDVPELMRYVVRTKEDAIESLVFPAATLKWKGTEKPVPASAGILFPTAVYKYAWTRVPVNAEPENAIADTLGKVNDAEFDGKDAGTLLCMPPTRRLYQAANSYTYLDIQYSLNYRPQGWNWFFDPDAGRFREVVRSKRPEVGAYETANFARLFDPSAA